MTILIADDEQLALKLSVNAVKDIFPNEEIFSASTATEIKSLILKCKFDLAFLDINMRGITGLEVAKLLKESNPQTNIIFVTGYDEFKSEAMDLHANGYLMKPVSKEKILEELKFLNLPIEKKKNKVYFKCLGFFECFYNDKPIEFKLSKTKELLAYMYDNYGALVSNNDIMSVLWEDEIHDNYLRQLKKDLVDTLTELGTEEIVIKQWGRIGIDISKISSDVDDIDDIPVGGYMIQYSWAETPNIIFNKNGNADF